MRDGVYLALAAIGLFLIVREQRGTPLLVTDEPDYVSVDHTQKQISQWSKVMLIKEGYWDAVMNAPTASYYSLPIDRSPGF